jgi:hypothetical protein
MLCYRRMQFYFDNAGDSKRFEHSTQHHAFCCDLDLAANTGLRLFAFIYGKAVSKPPSHADNGWNLYNDVDEYKRLGLIGGASSSWQLFINKDFILADSYPTQFIIPASTTESELTRAASFRSRGRVQAATWRHTGNGAVLARSSQPTPGATGKRCREDEDLIKAIANASGKSDALYIFDARSVAAATGNKMMGKGTENIHHYEGAVLIHCNIENIHHMRDSLNKLAEEVQPGEVANGWMR